MLRQAQHDIYAKLDILGQFEAGACLERSRMSGVCEPKADEPWVEKICQNKLNYFLKYFQIYLFLRQLEESWQALCSFLKQ